MFPCTYSVVKLAVSEMFPLRIVAMFCVAFRSSALALYLFCALLVRCRARALQWQRHRIPVPHGAAVEICGTPREVLRGLLLFSYFLLCIVSSSLPKPSRAWTQAPAHTLSVSCCPALCAGDAEPFCFPQYASGLSKHPAHESARK